MLGAGEIKKKKSKLDIYCGIYLKKEKSKIHVITLYLYSSVQDNSCSINHNLLMRIVIYIQQVNDKVENNIGERSKLRFKDMNKSQEDNLGEGL